MAKNCHYSSLCVCVCFFFLWGGGGGWGTHRDLKSVCLPERDSLGAVWDQMVVFGGWEFNLAKNPCLNREQCRNGGS